MGNDFDILEDFQENYGNGYVKSFRSTMNKGWYKKSEYFHLWHHLLYKANHKGIEFFFAGKNIKLNPGQFVTGRKVLAKETGINESKIERILTFFEKSEQQIEQQKSNKNRVITIVNWHVYQKSEQQTEQQLNNNWTTTEQQLNTNNNDNNINNDNNVKNKEQKFNFKNSFLELGVNEEILNDWLQVRKSKKASNTKTAFTRIINQINLSGLTVNECVQICAEKGWKGFEASWITNLNNNNGNAKKSTGSTGATIEDLREIIDRFDEI